MIFSRYIHCPCDSNIHQQLISSPSSSDHHNRKNMSNMVDNKQEGKSIDLKTSKATSSSPSVVENLVLSINNSSYRHQLSRRTMTLSPSLRRSTESNRNATVNESVIKGMATAMDAVVKVFCIHTEPNFSLPWQRNRQYSSNSTGFVISGRRVLTNAHSVDHYTQVKLKKRGSDTKYVATVLAVGTECDIGEFSLN